MAVFQDYLDNLPVFLPRFAPIFYQVCSDFGADLVLSDNTVCNNKNIYCDWHARYGCFNNGGRKLAALQKVLNCRIRFSVFFYLDDANSI